MNIDKSHKSFYNETREYDRGIFLIVLADQSLELYLGSDVVGEDFVEFKKSQGYDVDVIVDMLVGSPPFTITVEDDDSPPNSHTINIFCMSQSRIWSASKPSKRLKLRIENSTEE